MNCRTPLARRIERPSWSPAVLLLLLVLLTGCASRMTAENRESGTGAERALSKPSSSRPVTAAMQPAPSEVRAGGTFEILVQVEIAGGHHLYASNMVGQPFVPATLDVRLPHGVEALGDWIGSVPTRGRNGGFVYTDSALFRRLLKVHSNVPAGMLSIRGELHYQACTEELCWPPRVIQLSSSLRVYSSKR